MIETNRNATNEGQESYQRWRNELAASPGYQELYEEEAAKKELWLQLVEARQAAGLTQAEVAKRLSISQSQVSRIEKRGYDAYTLNSLRKYVKALGDSFRLEVKVVYLHSAA
ncbi:MAG: XRE family transcriptional regulator [Chloroflexi bacterium]|nr:XRE family transcriptional regulator [Chloroflexota bacterium]